MSKAKTTETKKALIVTDKQLSVIRDACELYGRVQIGQYSMLAEVITQTGINGSQIRIRPERKEDEPSMLYQKRCDELYEKDRLVCKALVGAINGIIREIYNWDLKERTNESSIALDIWAVLDDRREDGFHMGTEPLVKVKEVEENKQ